MTSPYPQPSPGRSEALALLREALAVALLLVGLVAMIWTLFQIDWRAGMLAVSILMVAAGVALGYRRPPR